LKEAISSSDVLRGVDTAIVFRLVRLISQPFEKWKAYELGVIDKDGKILIPKGERTKNQKATLTLFHKLARNIKKLLRKIPLGNTIIGSFAASMFLIKEHHQNPYGRNLEERFLNFYEENEKFINDVYDLFREEYEQLDESVTTGAVQGVDRPISMPYNPDKFMGMKVFDVDTERYMKSKDGKRKYTKYNRYVGDDDMGESIRQYGRKYPKAGIILRDSHSGSMIFLRKPQN